jgi:hypothetical protein
LRIPGNLGREGIVDHDRHAAARIDTAKRA